MSLKEKEVTTGKMLCAVANLHLSWPGGLGGTVSSGSLPKDTFSKWLTVSVTESVRAIDQGEVKLNEGEDLEMTRQLPTPSYHLDCTHLKHTNINCRRYYLQFGDDPLPKLFNYTLQKSIGGSRLCSAIGSMISRPALRDKWSKFLPFLTRKLPGGVAFPPCFSCGTHLLGREKSKQVLCCVQTFTSLEQTPRVERSGNSFFMVLMDSISCSKKAPSAKRKNLDSKFLTAPLFYMRISDHPLPPLPCQVMGYFWLCNLSQKTSVAEGITI
ncbi:hypothetical protein CDAR_6941 [Caerostris darwini]|uniref:Uncharacterized protein n=1 Tax=Caerostris darwini TaxID=1538125 RepID=A0AAV4PHC8_9ARAC|nr:hypothetical protein CDAR_6941 [Caerostris darwini]